MAHCDTEKGLDVATLRWTNLSYTVKGRETPILSNVTGSISSGELLAVMGPSGAGKSTFLDVLCKRVPAKTGSIALNGDTSFTASGVISFVEQDDALYGTLTVRETVAYAARLSLPPNFPDLQGHIDRTIQSLGLESVASNRIGTPIQRGISGGQKRRVTVACAMVSCPRILVLDEPTSYVFFRLDSASGREVVQAIKHLAQKTNTICIATIHQPAYETFALFDNLLLLSGGKVMFNDRTTKLDDYLTSLGDPTPTHVNPCDHVMSIVNHEFRVGAAKDLSANQHIDNLAAEWNSRAPSLAEQSDLPSMATRQPNQPYVSGLVSDMRKAAVLVDRNFTNYRRNLLAFGIRAGMYGAMGFLLGTVWIHLGTSTNKINDRLSVHFFSVAFLGFMSVSGIPAFLEERAVFVRERANGLYGPATFLVANTVTTTPFLFACTLIFALIAYWAIGLHPGADHFFKFLIYLFLGLLNAEFQSILVAAAVPIFVAALALACFANGMWMVVQGYFIRATSLPRFWYYTLHFIDFQTFSFELLVRNDVTGLVFQCPVVDGSCLCPMATSLPVEQCAVAGNDILTNLEYAGVSDGLYIGILLIMILVYRLLTYGILVFKKR